MRSIRLIVTVIILITAVCTIPCLLPADFSGQSGQSNCDLLAEAQQLNNGVTDHYCVPKWVPRALWPTTVYGK